jgi:hypothetical protein
MLGFVLVYKSLKSRDEPSFIRSVLRLVSTQENYPWIGTDKKILFFVLKSLVPTQR